MSRTPSFAVAVVSVLALGIGANTTIFSIVNAVLLRPLPFEEPERLVRIFTQTPDGRLFELSPRKFYDWQRDAQSFEGMAMYPCCGLRELALTGHDGKPRTLDEIGQVYGVTRERIRQIESKTMSKLRHPSRSQVLRDYLD